MPPQTGEGIVIQSGSLSFLLPLEVLVTAHGYLGTAKCQAIAPHKSAFVTA